MHPMLGKKCKDKITGLEGVIIARAEHITGCDQFLISPPLREGKFQSSVWCDIQRVVISEDEKIVLNNQETPGCDMSEQLSSK